MGHFVDSIVEISKCFTCPALIKFSFDVGWCCAILTPAHSSTHIEC